MDPCGAPGKLRALKVSLLGPPKEGSHGEREKGVLAPGRSKTDRVKRCRIGARRKAPQCLGLDLHPPLRLHVERRGEDRPKGTDQKICMKFG